ncbi:hypothetical protein COCMIDRAFT_6677 [Bipolaris oryzae ATCC 44560]|uniref:Uncharacterized protein n=1 Tax=Bipolaris oryzae ATCC 44560 TaxID=930090 RepID=W6Z1W7_COCMI|nr:uncharacterized protein COCMIDRAFT_6677 [Bipolaris oryzae ATCC 44560]EUC43975.1 hypothetical protein COCMIDRAFT_6677 [Bipolaris oryzae ATCC 44560]
MAKERDISNLTDWLTLECHKSSQLKVALLSQTLNGDILEETWRSQVTAAEVPVSYLLQETRAMSESRYYLIIAGKCYRDAVDEMRLCRTKMELKGRLIILDTPLKDSLTNSTNHESSESSPKVNGYSNGHSLRDEDVLKVQLGSSPNFKVFMSRFEKALYEDEVFLAISSISDPSRGSKLLAEQPHKNSVRTCFVGLKEAASLQDKTIICLLDGSFVSTWTSEEFGFFKAMVSSAKTIFCITHGTQMLQPSQRGLMGAGVPGLLPVLHNELPQVTLFHLDLSYELDAADTNSLELISKAFFQSVAPLAENDQPDLELAEINNHILIPRIIPDDGMDMEIALSTRKAQLLRQGVGPGRPLQLVGLDTEDVETHWQLDEDSDKKPNADGVEAAVTDISMCPIESGSRTAHSLVGSLITGTVTQYDANVSDLTKGDTVVVPGLPHCKTVIKQHQSLVARIDCTAPGSAAQVWVELMTSYILENITHIAAGEKILVQEGETALGKAIIRRAVNEFSAHVQATVTSKEQKYQLINQTGLSRDFVIVSSGAESPSALFSYLAHKTGGTGIDVVVYAGTGVPLHEEVALCLSDLSRVAAVVAPGQPLTSLPPFEGNVSFATVDPLRILAEQPRLVSTLLKRMRKASLKMADVISGTAFDVCDLDEAIRTAHTSDSNDIISVSLLPASEDTLPEVLVMPTAPELPNFDRDATYILAGGLGSLGLRVAEFMARNGATHLVFLSRSGNNRHKGKLKKLHELGCDTLVLACDVTSQQSVANMVNEVAQTGRSIKGLFQCAMVLQDSLFEKMTYDQWQTAFNPKVAGSWNLHMALPDNLDFFVMFPSVVSVIGNVSQTNYTAGNSYMDALAQHRRSLGMAGTSINAGLVADSDHTIDGTSMEDYLDRSKHIASPSGVDFWASDAKFMHRSLRKSGNDQSGEVGAGQEVDVNAMLAAAATIEDAQLIVQNVLKKLLAPGMGVQSAEIDAGRHYLSLEAVEVRNQIFRQLKCDVSVFEILSPNSLACLANQLLQRSPFVKLSSE